MRRRKRRTQFSRRNPVRRPSIFEPIWQGAPLAFAQLEDLFERIRHALQPTRPDIIDTAVRTGLRVVDLLEDFWHSMPPGSIRTEEEEEEEEREERRERRREREDDDWDGDDWDDDDDDDDWEPVRIRDRRRRRRDRDDDEDDEEDYREWRRRQRY